MYSYTDKYYLEDLYVTLDGGYGTESKLREIKHSIYSGLAPLV